MADPLSTPHERLFYEVMRRHWASNNAYPLPWWVQQYFRHWIAQWDRGLFDTNEAAFASNALYRYWHMVGVKDHRQESLVGQAGEIEPVYDQYSVTFFLFEPGQKVLHLPQLLDSAAPAPSVQQKIEYGYLPIVVTTYETSAGLQVEQRVFGVPVGDQQRDIVLNRLTVRPSGPQPRDCWLCVAVLPVGPSGFQRHDRAGRYMADGRVSYLQYLPGNEQLVQVNTTWGPVFDLANPPRYFGVYGNPDPRDSAASAPIDDPDYYLRHSPFQELIESGTLNQQLVATDYLGGMCSAAFAWPVMLSAPDGAFHLDIRLAVDNFRSETDLAELRQSAADELEQRNRTFWQDKLDRQGLQIQLPRRVAHLFDLFRFCRANLLILADQGAIHPGPTIYDEFWVRDSSVEGIACALNGDFDLARRQFSEHYPQMFNLGNEAIGPARAHGFFGGRQEKNGFEWDSNGQALWAFGRFDRIIGEESAFGARMFSPYVIEGAGWIRDNRREDGLLHSGWSAEHLGSRDVPHYWDDLWALAGLYEAGKLAERLNQPAAAQEIWDTFDDLKWATVTSIHRVLNAQRAAGEWKTYIPTGPDSVGDCGSTMIGAVAYFHPCRLHMDNKLADPVIDAAFRTTLDTIWFDFVKGGFEHRDVWAAYGPYLTIQLAHAFLFTGRVDRMDELLRWTVDAAFPTASRSDTNEQRWQVAQGAWNEQHCYPISTDFATVPKTSWYMGDIPHGWAAAEFNLLLRDILFFEADEDSDKKIYLAPGVMPHWIGEGEPLSIANAPTIFGGLFGYQLSHDDDTHTVTITITQQPWQDVNFVYPCRFGTRVTAVIADGQPLPLPLPGRPAEVVIPAGTETATVVYADAHTSED
ncbi:MAG: hypothetical protein ACRDYA_24265 [Egibacteraceae bacterium]